jgi:hypothetical protein
MTLLKSLPLAVLVEVVVPIAIITVKRMNIEIKMF